MMLTNLRHTLLSFALLTSLSFLTLADTACGSSEGPQRPEVVIDLTGDAGIGPGCSQPLFPADQPDIPLFQPPQFVTASGEEQLRVRPGQELRAEISVNGQTREIRLELRNVWSPEQVIATESLDTPGSQTVPVIFFPPGNVHGRFYMRLTLCGLDCDERQVVFDIIEPDPDELTTGVKLEYARTLIENGEVIQVDQTCVEPNSVLIQ